MQTTFVRLARQPQVAIAASALAAATMAVAYMWGGTGWMGSGRSLALAAGLATAIAAAYRFPIYVHHNLKMAVTSIPLFLMAALLAPALAASACALGTLGGEMLVRRQRGTYFSDIATTIGRRVLVVLAGALVAHARIGGDAIRDLPLLCTAGVLWLGDALTLPLVLVPITGEKPWPIVRGTIQEGGAAEAGQYLMGMLGVLLAMQQVWALVMLIVPAGLVYLSYRKEMDADSLQLLEGLADTVDLRDPRTGGHSRRVAVLVEGMLRELGMHGTEARQIITAARLHDIGKIAMPDSILLKAGHLTAAEQNHVQSCLSQAEEILRDYPDFSRGLEMILHHHERWDGTGYPDRLAGTEIPFGARVIAVADSFDAMTTDRPYRSAMLPDGAAAVLRDGRGSQWDPQVTDAFLRSISERLQVPVDAPRKRAVLPRAPITAGHTASGSSV